MFSAELHNPITQPWISLAYSAPNYILTVQTNDPVYFTNAYVTFWVKVSLSDYSTLNPVNDVRWEPIQIMLKNCQVTDFTFPAVADVTYCIYTPVTHILMTQFTEVDQAGFIKPAMTSCGYAITYTAKWRDYYDTVIALPPFVTWNPTDFRYEVFSQDVNDLTDTR